MKINFFKWLQFFFVFSQLSTSFLTLRVKPVWAWCDPCQCPVGNECDDGEVCLGCCCREKCSSCTGSCSSPTYSGCAQRLVGKISGEPTVNLFHYPNYFFPGTEDQRLLIYTLLTVEPITQDKFLGEIGLGDEVCVVEGSFEYAPSVWKTWVGEEGHEWKLQLGFDRPSGGGGIDMTKENILAIEGGPVFVLSNKLRQLANTQSIGYNAISNA